MTLSSSPGIARSTHGSGRRSLVRLGFLCVLLAAGRIEVPSLHGAAAVSVGLPDAETRGRPSVHETARNPAAPEGPPLVLWYDQPARRWLEALPVGNGRLGAMVFGGTTSERLALNESTFWSGAPGFPHDSPTALEHLPEVRRLLFEGQFRPATDLIQQHLLGRQGNYGTHLPVGDLWLDLGPTNATVTGYRRELDLDSGIARTEYTLNGVHYTREVLVSHPDQVIVIRLGADQPGRITFRACFKPARPPGGARAADERTLVITASARETKHSDGTCGVDLAGRIQAVARGGRVQAVDGTLAVEGADAALLVCALETGFRGGNPELVAQKRVAAAAGRPETTLRDRHLQDHRRLFRRVRLDLGRSPAADLPTDRRLARVKEGQDDAALAALFFQYGRYLLIAGSREDSPLPTNLQGIWNDNLACDMGWTCDFHLDINTQQNYWPAEVTGLPECHEPLFRLIEALREPGRRTARTVYGAPGWVCHVFTNPWGFTAPGWGLGWGLHPTAGIWLASHLWQHYEFTEDREFLRQRAYPVLKEAAEFFLDYLVEHPKHGWLVSGPATSPENAFVDPSGQGPFSESMGPTCDAVLIRDLLESCIAASRILDVDPALRERWQAAVGRLPPLRVGKLGQLMEWLEDYAEAAPNHRHTTHLVALYPGSQITPEKTPDLARAARVTLRNRLGRPDWEDVEWSRGNLVNFYARLGEGTEAHHHLVGLLREDTDLNLLTFSRGGIAGAPQNIFCVDGNSAASAGIAEMLVQSHGDVLRLLPALPAAWPAGQVRGLRARGNVMVDLDWSAGKVTRYTLRSTTRKPVWLRIGSETTLVTPEAAE